MMWDQDVLVLLFFSGLDMNGWIIIFFSCGVPGSLEVCARAFDSWLFGECYQALVLE